MIFFCGVVCGWLWVARRLLVGCLSGVLVVGFLGVCGWLSWLEFQCCCGWCVDFDLYGEIRIYKFAVTIMSL